MSTRPAHAPSTPSTSAPRSIPRLLPLIKRLWIVDKHARRVRLGDVLKDDQLDLIARAQAQLDTRGQIRLIVLKARQIGVCLAPETRVLTADLRWVPIDSLSVGDQLVATDEHLTGSGPKPQRKLREAVVEARREVHAEAYRLDFDSGESLIATSEHRFLCLARGATNTRYYDVATLGVGDRVKFVTHPWGGSDYEDGWFGGFLDGEGSCRPKERAGSEVCVSQVAGAVLDRGRRYLASRGYTFREERDTRIPGTSTVYGSKPVHRLVVSRLAELFRLIGQTRPSRFVNSTHWWEGKCLPGRRVGGGSATIIRKTPLGPHRMIDIQTSTGTFIAEGFVSHNSTVIEAIMFVLTMIYSDFNALIMSHEKESAARILKMTRTYWDTYPFKRFYTERYNGRSHLAWDNGSDIHIATARNTESGRSLTLQALHASECGFWSDPETLYNSLAHSVPAFGLNMIALESTANGVGNFFHKESNKAMREETDFEFVFYPWFNDPDYTMIVLPHIVRERYQVLGELDDEERLLVKRYHVTDDQLAWRRWCIANECQGDVAKYHQEFPSNPHEAFISTGRNVFALPRLLEHAKVRRGLKGILRKVHGRVTFIPDKPGSGHPGWLTLYREPSDDRDWGHYVVGADPTHAPGGDYACAQVLNRRTLEQVAVYRNKTVDTVTFGKHLQLIGAYFNLAVIAAESTGPGYATTGCLVADNYPRVYQRQHIDKMQGYSTRGVAGWITNQNTKEVAIQHLVKLFSEELVDPGDGEEYGLLLHDRVTVMELRDYIKVEKGLGYGNSDGSEYDDGVMALAIACAVHVLLPPVPAYVTDPLGRRPRVSIPTTGHGLAMMAGTALVDVPRDPYVDADDAGKPDPDNPDNPDNPPVWEAWGRPRDGDIGGSGDDWINPLEDFGGPA